MFTEAKLDRATSSGNTTVGAETNKAELRSHTDVPQISSVLFLWGVFLSFYAKISIAKFIAEWGGAEGISGCSLASSPS
jgi:hypothetical protein